MIQFKALHHYATEPTRATDGSAGFDLYAVDNVTVWPGAHVKIGTGIAMSVPEGYAGFLWPRSGLATKHGFDLLAGLLDSDYRGEIHVCGINHGNQAVDIKRGDRIAQIVVSPIVTLAKVVDELDDTERGSGSFGSTGV